MLLLPDFPLDLIIEASDFAVRVLDGFGIRIPTDQGSLDFGWVDSFSGWSSDAGHHFTSSSWTACPICRNSRQMIPGWCESVEHRNVRCTVFIFEKNPELHVIFMSAFIGNMCVY